MRLSFSMSNIVFILLGLAVGSQSLSLDELSAPSSHPAGQDLILDCDYSYLKPESDQLVLTWYFNGSPIPIYQWVPALDLGPQVIHQMFKDNLDLKYQAHNEELKKHAALRIVNPDQRFSGSYKCRVSTFLEEVSAQQDVLVYVAPASITLTSTEGAVRCQVEAVYPLPTLVIVWTANSSVYSSDNVEITTNPLNPALLDASVAATVEQSDITPLDMMTCEVTLTGTDFVKRVEKNILEKIEPSINPEEEVELTEDICESADCNSAIKTDDIEAYPVDYEAVDKTIEVGAAVDTFSEEAATFVESCSCSACLNILLCWTSAVVLHWSW
eukprot:GFUD01025665.1.p1 GENE.GFUD01025665.1~~GFUD01025665.1.p1  ORF type:complete len:340 (+),score=87.11 GFUD01025665.1:37-1020(+)